MASKTTGKSNYRHPRDLTPEEKMIPISARVPESIVERLNTLGTKHGHSISRLVLEAIEGYLREIGEHPDKTNK